MEQSKAFLENDIIGICSDVTRHCNTYILNQTHLPHTQAYAFYSYLPALLDRILGSPTKRGFLQMDLPAEQINALLQLLSVHGVFMKSLFLLSNFTQYSYELITSNLSKDIGEVLSSGAVQLLPRVYNNTCNTSRSKSDNAFVLRTAATSHSTLLPQSGKDNRTIRFNMLQFYLFHFVSVPTFSSTTPSSFTVSKTPTSSYNSTSCIPTTTPTQPTMYNNNINNNVNNSNYKNNYNNQTYQQQQQQQHRSLQYSSSNNNNTYLNNNNYSNSNSNSPNLPRSPSNNNNSNSTINNGISSQPPLLRPGSLSRGPYKNLVRDYFTNYIPRHQGYSNTFFLDTCIELWIRTVSVPPNGKLNDDLMYYITYFLQYIMASDLRRDENRWIYESCHQEIYLLISRLLLNYTTEQPYLPVVDLWTLWASPWRFGETPKSVVSHQNMQSLPFATLILDNVPVYFQLVDILLSKTSTYTFTNMKKASPFLAIENVDHQIRILHRLNNVLYTDHLTQLLGMIEWGLYKIDNGSTQESLEPLSRYTGLSQQELFQKLKSWHALMTALDGGVFKRRYLYINNNETRFEYLTKTVLQVQQAIDKMDSNSILGVSVMQRKQQVTELKKAEEKLRFVFDLSRTQTEQAANRPMVNGSQQQPPEGPVELKKRVVPLQAGLKNGGFLTQEELTLVKEGYLLCSKKNIPKVGRRPRTVVKSYEWAAVLMWTVNMEDKINPWYTKKVPEALKKKFNLPDQICIRFLAAPINWPYMLLAFILSLYIIRLFFRLLFRLVF